METPTPDRGDRSARIRRAVYEFLTRRQAGEDVSPEAFTSGRADLLPELEAAVRAALRTYRHVSDVQRAMESPAVLSQHPPTESGVPAVRGYRMRREIGSGGQGTVYEAVHEPTGRVVAVKVLTGVSKNAVARFDREAQVLARLTHPGLLTILDRGLTQDGSYYLSVEYVAGKGLDDWVTALPPANGGLRELIFLFARIAAALGAAHAQGITHRDLKPSNVRVDELGNPRVIDFGLARLKDNDPSERHLTQTRDVVGSIEWLSPEQAAGDTGAVGPASDVYAVGLMIYRTLTGGRFPYPVDGPLLKVIREISETPPGDPNSVRSGRFGKPGGALAHVILKCLAKDPARRYATGADLAADLNAFLHGTLRISGSPTARRRLWGAVLLTSIVVAAAIWSIGRRPAMPAAVEVMPFPTFHNSVGMEFVELPAGRFRMGSPHDESGRADDEQPHVVRLTSVTKVGRTEVTRSQFQQVMGSLPPGVDAEPGNFPVDRVTWDEANEFCRRLTRLDGRPYRLPTEAEWEYAARAGSPGPVAGNGRLDDMAWDAENSAGRLHPVSTRQPNRFGLYDMQGNAAEWTLDQYTPHLGSADVVDPAFRVGDTGNAIRGGSAADSADVFRLARRTSAPPTVYIDRLGFRVVMGNPSPDPTR